MRLAGRKNLDDVPDLLLTDMSPKLQQEAKRMDVGRRDERVARGEEDKKE